MVSGVSIMSHPVLSQAAQFLKAGQRKQALSLLVPYVKQHPDDAIAWYGLALAVEEPAQKIDCLEMALTINPDFSEAVTQLENLKTRYPTEVVAAESKSPDQNTDEQPQVSLPLEQMHEPLQESEPAVSFPPWQETPEISEIKLEPTQAIEPEQVVVEAHPLEETLPEEKVTSPATTPSPVTTTINNKIPNPAGGFTSRMAAYFARRNKIDRIFFYFFFVMLLLCIPMIFIYHNKPAAYLGTVFIVLYLYKELSTIIRYEKEDRLNKNTYAKGARGEIEIGKLLGKLGENFKVWHDVPSNFGNIDHIVLCKNGEVVLIETKAHSGTVKIEGTNILINGQPPEKNMIRQCLQNVFYLRELIQTTAQQSVWITPILVFTDAFVNPGKPIKGIRIMNKKYLLQTIHELANNVKYGNTLWSNSTSLDQLFNLTNPDEPTYKHAFLNAQQVIAKLDFQRPQGYNKRNKEQVDQDE